MKKKYTGTYRLSKSMNVDEIIKVLNSADSLENETITVTFIEGKRLTDYVKKSVKRLILLKKRLILNYLMKIFEKFNKSVLVFN